MKYSKFYYEEYAKISVCYLLNLDTNNFILNADKPDLQNNLDNIGVEVVRTISDNEGLTQSLINKYFGRGLSGTK